MTRAPGHCKILIIKSFSVTTYTEALLSNFLTFGTNHRQSETENCKGPAKLSEVKFWVSATELAEVLGNICCN